MIDLPIAVAPGQFLHLGLFVVHLEIDFAAAVVPPQWPDQFTHGLAGGVKDVQGVHQRHQGRVGVEIVLVIVMAGQFAPEDRVRIPHGLLHVGMAHPLPAGRAAVLDDLFHHDPAAKDLESLVYAMFY